MEGSLEGSYIVADFGKTLTKLTLWSKDGRCLERVTRSNASGKSTLDADGIGAWLIDALARFAGHPVEAIVPVAHGAAVVAVRDGTVAVSPLDYEQTIPDAALAAYRAQRDPFAVTGSPGLPLGLNLGAQLHWLDAMHGQNLADATLLPYAQYWAWFLSGQGVSEATSLGCHTDLWNPTAADFSPMAKRRGWAARFAPVVRAADVVGILRPELAARTGLSRDVKIYAGLHDSNAALLAARGFPEIDGREATVLSTGTWFVAMRTPREPVDIAALPEDRDCLVNVDVLGRPIPSARFMGGREIEALIEIDTRRVDIVPDQPALVAAVRDVVENDAMVLPGFVPGCGPFPAAQGRWIARPQDWFARRAAACLYAALMTDTSLSLIGAKQTLLIEGRFAEAQVFVRALASLRPDLTIYTAQAHNDVSFGALRLIDPLLRPQGMLSRVHPLDVDLSAYAARWRELAA